MEKWESKIIIFVMFAVLAIGSIAPLIRMIRDRIAYLNFYFAKTGKNGLNARMEQKKSREKSLDLYED